MTEYEKLQIALGYVGANLNSSFPAYIMLRESCEGREISPEEAGVKAREVLEYLDKKLMEEGARV